jgi:integrase
VSRKRIEKGLYRDTRSGIYYAREQLKGKRTWKSLGTDKIGVAREALKAYMRGELTPREKRAAGAGGRTFDEIFDVTIEIQNAKAEATAAQTRYQIDKYLRPWFKEHCPTLAEFEPKYSEIWARYQKAQAILTPERGLTHDRRFLVMALLRAHERAWIGREFSSKDFHVNYAPAPVGRTLQPEEVARLREILDERIAKAQPQHRDAAEKARLQIMIAFRMGPRKGEILKLEPDEIDLKHHEIRIHPRKIKTRQPRKHPIPIHVEVEPLLRAWLEKLPKERPKGKRTYLFPKVYSALPGKPVAWDEHQEDLDAVWYRVLKGSGIKARYHDLRHTAVSGMIADGIPPGTISQTTGQSIKVIMEIYAHIFGDITKRLRRWGMGG